MRQTRSFSNQPESVAAARRFASQALGALPPEAGEAVELMVSELATNCIRHTGGEFALTILACPREIRVEASDEAGGEPALRSPTPSDLHGRGLRIIDLLSQSWGVDARAPRGKTVWFTVPRPLPH